MRLLLILVFLIFALEINAQRSPIIARAIIVNGDTIPIFDLNEVYIFSPKTFKNKSQALEYTKLVRNVKKVYPYALIAREKMKECDARLMKAKTKSERNKIVKEMQRELFAEYEEDLKKLTYSQGKILLKLIDRETGSPTYHIIKEYKGSITAGFWQTIGRLFGYNLKEDYDPQGADREIENIVIMIEKGAI